MSYDVFFGSDEDRADKTSRSKKAIKLLESTPDLAAVITVTDQNVTHLPEIVKELSGLGIWFLFDLFHTGHGPLSKCGNEQGVYPPETEKLRESARQLLELKKSGAKIHASENYLKLLAEHYEGDPRSFWHCTHDVKEDTIGWLTVDSDGSFLACDDYQSSFPGGKIWDRVRVGELFEWMRGERTKCVGCAWNTHVDACNISEGASIGSYIHLPSSPRS
jgi:MoaA/NifB/PqqE/SkfB family radical SAM enzyme